MTDTDDVTAALADWWDRAPEDEGVWEPYSFKVGDRVRCVPSPECPQYEDWTCRALPHGFVGNVLATLDQIGGVPYPSDGHRFCVGKVDTPDGRYVCGWFAAIELEPLADSAAEAGPAGE